MLFRTHTPYPHSNGWEGVPLSGRAPAGSLTGTLHRCFISRGGDISTPRELFRISPSRPQRVLRCAVARPVVSHCA